MAEKPKGQAVEPTDADPKDKTPKDDTVPEDKPKDQPPEPTIPKEYEGKTLEDLIKMDQESRKTIGEQAKQVGDLKSNLAYADQLRQLEVQRIKEERATQKTEEPKVEWNFEEPIKSTREIVRQELERDKQAQQQENLKRVQDEAKSYYAEGRSLSMRQNPKLFEGVEREIEDAVYKSYMNGIIGIHDLRNPEVWNMTAKLKHLGDGNLDRLQPTSIKPVDTTSTELPNPAKPGSTEKSFTGLDHTDEGVQQMMKQYGLTKEEAEEIIKEEQERITGGGK